MSSLFNIRLKNGFEELQCVNNETGSGKHRRGPTFSFLTASAVDTVDRAADATDATDAAELSRTAAPYVDSQ